jgi:hypothetical protein
MQFTHFFELLDYIYFIYFSYPEIDPEFTYYCESIDTDLDYPDGLEGILNDIFKILGEQYESDFFDETPEALHYYELNLQTLAEIGSNLRGKFDAPPFHLTHFPSDGHSFYSSWKAYLRKLGHELEQNHFVGGIHPLNLHYLILFISNNRWEFNFSEVMAGDCEAIHNAFDEFLNPFSPNGGNYSQLIQEFIDVHRQQQVLSEDIFKEILQKLTQDQPLKAIEKYLLMKCDNISFLRLIEEKLPKNHEITRLIQRTIAISDSKEDNELKIDPFIIWL